MQAQRRKLSRFLDNTQLLVPPLHHPPAFIVYSRVHKEVSYFPQI